MKPLGDAFIKLIKMLIAPIIFCTVVHGIASMEDMKKVGRVGLKALIYFEVMTTVALIIGLVVVNLWQPGAGMNVDPATLDTKAIATYTAKAGEQSTVEFLLHIIPATVVGAFAEGEILQVLFVRHPVRLRAALAGRARQAAAAPHRPDRARLLRHRRHRHEGGADRRLRRHGLHHRQVRRRHAAVAGLADAGLLRHLPDLRLRRARAGRPAAAASRIFKFIRYIKEELLIVLGTSSSESVLPRMLAKMENLGADKSVVGLVIPTGYSFNLDGTCIYLTMAAVFLAQATNTDLSLGQELGLIGILLLTSKGAAGVTGSGFIVLAATLASLGTVPVASIALILGVDRFMSEARALTNLVGNGVATIVVAKWEGALDEDRMHKHLNQETDEEADDPEAVLVADEIDKEPHIPGSGPKPLTA